MEIRIDKLENKEDIEILSNMVQSRLADTDHLEVNLSNLEGMSLPGFNAMVQLYMRVARQNKQIAFKECQCKEVLSFIHSTKMYHVFHV